MSDDEGERRVEFPVADRVDVLDVTIDGRHLLVSGRLENGTSFRFPIAAPAAMRLLALLPDVAINRDTMQ